MKIAALMVVAAALLPLSAKADGPVKVSDFPLADRIKEKVASGKPLDIYVSYHDVSNEFAPAIKAGVAKGAGRRQGERAIHRAGRLRRQRTDQ
jgi:simple sugar transport system substrate-binding protein